MASKSNFGKRLRVTEHEYRKTNYGAAIRWGCSYENRFVSERWHPSFNGRNTENVLFFMSQGPGPPGPPLGRAPRGGGGCINSPVPVRVKICFADFMPPIVIIFRTESSFKILGGRQIRTSFKAQFDGCNGV